MGYSPCGTHGGEEAVMRILGRLFPRRASKRNTSPEDLGLPLYSPAGPGGAEDILKKRLESHARWLASGGREGERGEMSGAFLPGAFLFMADARRASFERSRMLGTNAQWADLREANLRGGLLTRADFFQSDLAGADLREADLKGASFFLARLSGARLEGADLRGADLRGATLRNVDLRGCHLSGALLEKADLQGADLRGTDLAGAAGLTRSQLEAAVTDPATRPPKELGPDAAPEDR